MGAEVSAQTDRVRAGGDLYECFERAECRSQRELAEGIRPRQWESWNRSVACDPILPTALDDVIARALSRDLADPLSQLR